MSEKGYQRQLEELDEISGERFLRTGRQEQVSVKVLISEAIAAERARCAGIVQRLNEEMAAFTVNDDEEREQIFAVALKEITDGE